MNARVTFEGKYLEFDSNRLVFVNRTGIAIFLLIASFFIIVPFFVFRYLNEIAGIGIFCFGIWLTLKNLLVDKTIIDFESAIMLKSTLLFKGILKSQEVQFQDLILVLESYNEASGDGSGVITLYRLVARIDGTEKNSIVVLNMDLQESAFKVSSFFK